MAGRDNVMPADRSRLLLVVGVLAAAASLLIPDALGVRLHAAGLLEAAVGGVLLVASSALALNGSRPTPLPARRLFPAVLATNAANAVTPAGIGGTLLILRLHRRSGLSDEQAVAAAGARSVAGGVAVWITTLLMVSTVHSHSPAGALRWVPFVVGGTALVVALAVPALRTRLRHLVAAIGRIARNPRCLVSLMVGCAGVTLSQLVILHGAVGAVGGEMSWTALLATLMGSAAARSAVPSPGGVGPVEAALVAGLSGLGLSVGAAAAAVAVYRTAGHWLPVVGGVVSLRGLRRAELV